MKVFAIVVTYNGEKWIDKCFGSLVASSIPLQILAIDNASSDNTVSQIKNQFPEVEIIETGANLGFGKANSIGLKKALDENAHYVFLLNQDAWIEANTIENLIQVAEKNNEYGIVSPFHLLPNCDKLEWHFSIYISPEKCVDLYSDIYFGTTKNIYSTNFINAAAWLITRKCLLQVGAFDPLFSHYGEDEDYCQRLTYKKFKVGVSPTARIFHDISMKSWDDIKYNFNRRLIFVFIELKNINLSYTYILLNYVGKNINRLLYLLWTRKWKDFFFTAKIFFVSFAYFSKIGKSRNLSKKELSYLN